MSFLDLVHFHLPMLGVIESIGAAASYALYASLITTAVSGYISYDASQTQAQQAKYNADAQADAITQEQNRKAAEDAENRRRAVTEQRRIRAQQLAAMSGSGAMLGTGTSLAIEADTWATQQTQLADQQRVAELAQRDLAYQASSTREMGAQQAAAYRREGTGAAISGIASAAGTGYSAWSTRPQTTRTPGVSIPSGYQAKGVAQRPAGY